MATIHPHRILLLCVGGWFFYQATIGARLTADTWWPMLILLGQASRYGTPLALTLMAGPGRALPSSPAEWLLRCVAAATFFGHGVRAILQDTNFVELLGANAGFQGPAAGAILTLIGGVDVLAAGAILATRSRRVAGYMSVWAASTAVSRITAYGIATGWPMALVRTGNFAVPLCLLVTWWGRHQRPHRVLEVRPQSLEARSPPDKALQLPAR